MDILVIGDKGHSRAECFDWMEDWPNIEEFDLAIIALNTLDEEALYKISEKLRDARKQIHTIFKTERSVWCIIERRLMPAPPPSARAAIFRGVSPQAPTNYDWLYVDLAVTEVPDGHTVITKDPYFQPYLDKVKAWNLEVEMPKKPTYIGAEGLREAMLELGIEREDLELLPIAINKSDKMIAAKLVCGQFGGSICLLPKPTTCNTSEGIELLIDIATEGEGQEFEWRSEIDIPGIAQLEEEMRQTQRQFQARIEILRSDLRRLDQYRDVFSVHEGRQVEAVRRILDDIGIRTERTQPGFLIDLVGKDVAVEATSIGGKIDSTSRKMFQLLQYIEKCRKHEKVILVANTYKRLKPQDRKNKENFTSPVMDFLKIHEVCAMTAITLLELWKGRGKDTSKPREVILQTKGELTLD